MAVAYEETFYIGQVTKKIDVSHVVVKFLERNGGVYYQWPKKDDVATLDTKFVPEGKHFELKEPLEGIQKLYRSYKKKYFLQASSAEPASEVVCKGTVQSSNVIHFWPVDGVWHREKCSKFDLFLAKRHPLRSKKSLGQNAEPTANVSVKADGNCFLEPFVTG